MSEKKRPWGKWYWGDWRKDARLRRCSFAARGLWADMLSLMGGECDEFGYLSMEGQALQASDLAELLGGSEREIAKLLTELEQKRVFNRIGDADLPEDVIALLWKGAPEETIISRRMVRDKAKAEQDRLNGKEGGNPSLKRPDNSVDNSLDNGGVNPPDKAQRLEARGQRPERESTRSANLGAVNGHAQKPVVNRAKPLPDGFVMPPEWLAAAAEKRRQSGLPSANLPLEAEQFIAHQRKTAGSSFDWQHAWLSWALRAKPADETTPPQRPKFVPL